VTGTPGEYQIFLRSTSPNYDPQVFVLNFATSISPCDQDRIVQPIPDSSYGICVTRKYFILFYSLLLKKKIAFFKKKKKKKKKLFFKKKKKKKKSKLSRWLFSRKMCS